MRRRQINARVHILIGAAFGSLCFGALVDTAKANDAAAPAPLTVEIAEGTPVVVHFFGSGVGAFSSCHLSRDKGIVLQVDQDVIVSGTIVVPRGSLGLAQCDQKKEGKFQQDFGNVRTPGFFGPRIAHEKGPTRNGVIQYVFHHLYVFSIASTQLDLDSEPNFIDVAHHNGYYGQYGLDFDVDIEFTAKLKHAVVTLPLAP